MRALVGALGLALAACATPLIPAGELHRQLLRPHKGFPGKLVNQDYDEAKKEWHRVFYDVEKPEDRKRLNDAKFECQIAGHRFAICLDQPGYCERDRVPVSWFLGIKWWPTKHELRVVTYIPAVEGHQRLVDAGTECFAQDLFTLHRPWGGGAFGGALP